MFDDPVASLQLGLGSGARAEPPLASDDHPQSRFRQRSLGFARVDLAGSGEDERLVATLIQTPPWPFLNALPVSQGPVARFAVDRAGRVERLPPTGR